MRRILAELPTSNPPTAKLGLGVGQLERWELTALRSSLVKRANKGGGPAETAESVSELTTNRLSVYLRCLNVLDGAGVRTVSSQSLAEQFHLNAAQIRKD